MNWMSPGGVLGLRGVFGVAATVLGRAESRDGFMQALREKESKQALWETHNREIMGKD